MIVRFGYATAVVSWSIFGLPNEVSYEIVRAANLIHQQPEICDFHIVNADEHRAVRSEELAEQRKPRVHHA